MHYIELYNNAHCCCLLLINVYGAHFLIKSPNKKYMLASRGFATLASFLSQRHIFLKR